MKRYALTFIITLLLIFLLIPFSGWGEGYLTRQNPIELTAMLGNKNGGQVQIFKPQIDSRLYLLSRLIF